MSSPLVTTAWLAANLGRTDLRILDCAVTMRTHPDGTYGFVPGRDEWLAGHVPGSDFVDVMGELSAQTSPLPLMMPPAAEFAATMERYGVGVGTHVVLYDRGNHAWAARVWWMLRACGFDAAQVLDGGWQKWAAEGRPVSTAPATYARGTFAPHVRTELFATKDEVLAALGRPDVTLVNALSPEEHRGTAATRLPRSGRIPGSRNVFVQTLTDPDSKAYKTKTELEALFVAAGALGAQRTIVYCGAGIAASSDALALTLLGTPNVAVYDGSLSEWTADAALPMERG
jgi:thiosulfate/3-mercaptopyruvate sulfurtransferase